jgi:D5-like protein
MQVDTNPYKNTTPPLHDHNGWADFWRYRIGINVIPAVYKHKIPIRKWTTDPMGNWEIQPIPEELHNEWKADNLFVDGMALVMGHVWHNGKHGKYLASIDGDNGLASELLMFRPERSLVQQRKNALDRSHSFFYSPRPVKRKPASSTNDKELEERFKKNLAPKFEVRCVGDLIYAGKHETGFYYEISGIADPIELSDVDVVGLEKKVHNICVEFGLNNLLEQPASNLFKEDFVIHEGNNRSLALKRAMLRLLRMFHGDHTLEEIKVMAHDWESRHSKPPYPPETGIFERNWKQAVDIVMNDRPLGNFLEESASQGQATDSDSDIDPAERIMQESTFKTCTDNGELYYYNGKIYIPGQEWRIREQARQIDPVLQNRDITEIISYIKDSTYLDRSQFDSNQNIITVDNGLLNIRTKELSPFRSDHLSLVKLPMPYDPKADCPRIRQFLQEVMNSQEDINWILSTYHM